MARLIDRHLPSPRFSGPGTIERPVDTPADSGTEGWVVVVYDNDINTFEEVVHILMVATACEQGEAEMETWEIHHLGKSVVHHGAQDECEAVAYVIGGIGIRAECIAE